MPGDDEVQFQSPTSGAVQAISPEHWDEALGQGYKPTTHKVMYSPDGRRGMVHNSQLADHMKQGYQVTPETQFEKERTPEGSAFVRGAKAFGGGLLNAAEAVGSAFGEGLSGPNPQHIAESAANLALADQQRKEEGRSGAYRGLALGSSIAGVDPSGMEEAGRHGDTAGVLGSAAGQATVATAPLIGEGIGKGVSAGSKSIGKSIVDSTGRPKPIARLLLGNDRATALGELANPELADARVARQAKSEALSSGRTAPGPWTPAKAIKEANAPLEPELGSPENPGLHSKMPTRMPRPAVTSLSESPNLPRYQENLANQKPVSITEDPYWNQKKADYAEGGAGPTESILGQANAPVRGVRESEGSAARWTNEDVIRLAKQGVRPAIEQARQRGFELPENVRYVAGDLAYPSTELNPREVTRFTPEGEPIRQGIAPQPQSEIPNVQGRKLYPSPPPKSIAPVPPSLDFERAINVPSEQPLGAAPEPLDRRVNGGKPPEGTPERRGVYDIHKANVGPTEGEKLAQEVRAARAEQPSSITEGEALQRIMRDPAEYEKYKAADQKTRDRMLVSTARGSSIAPEQAPNVESLGQPITESEIPRSITAPEEEAEPAEIKGITEPVNPKRAPKEKTVPIDKRFSQDEITDAEGLIAQEVGAMQAADRPGTYFDESEPGDVRTGSRQIKGGDWRAVKSGRNMHPFMKANPQFNPEQLRKALRNKDSAMYQKAIERAVDFIRRSKVSEGVEPEEIESGAEEFPFGANKK